MEATGVRDAILVTFAFTSVGIRLHELLVFDL